MPNPPDEKTMQSAGAAADSLGNENISSVEEGCSEPRHTKPSGPPGGKPTSGTRTNADNPSLPKEQSRGFRKENESADVLASHGYQVEQNPGKLPNGKDPDYKIEGQIFDNLSPTSSNVDQVRKGISRKVKAEQADRILLNLNDSSLSPNDVKEVLSRKPIKGLKEVIAIKDGNIVHIFP